MSAPYPDDVQDITYNATGHSFFFQAPSRPASVESVKIVQATDGDDTTAEDASTGSAAIDAVNTTTDAAAGFGQANPKIIPLTATTSIVNGRHYILRDLTGGFEEWVQAMYIESTVAVRSRVPLLNSFVSGSTFEGTLVSIGVDPTWAADLNNISDGSPNPGYRVIWSWTDADSVQHVDYTFFDLTRRAGQHNVKPTDMEFLIPGWSKLLPRDHQIDKGAGLLDESYRQVKIDLHQQDIPDQMVRHQDIIDELVKRKVIVMFTEWRAIVTNGDLGAVDVARSSYEARFNKLIRAPSTIKVPVGTDQTGAAGTVFGQSLTTR
jgi:hypothetical protein